MDLMIDRTTSLLLASWWDDVLAKPVMEESRAVLPCSQGQGFVVRYVLN